MIRINSEKTTLEKNIEEVDRGILQIAQHTNNFAAALQRVNDKFWGLPDEELIELLNAIGPQKVAAIFEQNTKLGLAVNESLDAVDEKSLRFRAPVTQGRSDVIMDEKTGKFSVLIKEPDTDTSKKKSKKE